MKLRKRKFVNSKKRLLYFSLFFMLLLITVGYAYLSAALSINGHTELSANTWNIHFENLSVTGGSVSATTPAAIQSNTTSINYSVLLDMPGDFYEFSVDVVNSGTIGGKVTLVNIQGISSAAEPYLETSIKYSNGLGVQVDDLLNPNSSKRLVVRVGYKQDINSLPNDDISLDLTFRIDYSQSNEVETSVGNLLQQLLAEGNTCITKYTGQVTDRVGVTETATNVYTDGCIDKRNVIFGGFCWQIVRSTQTNGLKMIYDGIPVDGKCELERPSLKVPTVNNPLSDELSLSGSYLFGNTFTYNTNNDTFTLVDTVSATWSDSTYQNLIGKYTCKNSTGTCSKLYYVTGYISNTEATMEGYDLYEYPYYVIAEDSFSANLYSLASSGYMYNNSYYMYEKRNITGTVKFGSSVAYNNGNYIISGSTVSPSSRYYTSVNDTNKKYTCWNSSGTCSTVSYVSYMNYNASYGDFATHINIKDGKDLNGAYNDMLWSNDVNKYDSSAKALVDRWYKENLLSYAGRIEDTVYCNNRSPYTGSEQPNVGSIGVYFKNLVLTSDLTCENDTDQFAVSNNKAKLTYPVALIGAEELMAVSPIKQNNTIIDEPGNMIYHTMTPSFQGVSFVAFQSLIDFENYIGGSTKGIRPVISLDSSAVIKSGSGSKVDPWIID